MSLPSNTEYKLTEYAAETMVYFERHKLIEIAKKILVECALLRPKDPQEWIAKNIKHISHKIYQACLNEGQNATIKSLHMSTSFLHRIVIFGRPGSGRKTQANNLAQRFNLVLSMSYINKHFCHIVIILTPKKVNAEMLIFQHLRGDDDKPLDSLDRDLQRSFYYNNCLAKSKALLNILARRILEKDCLQRGWVLINFTHYLQDFIDILENFKIPPNKLVYLKCPENICMRRLINMPDLNKPQHNYTYYEQEMRFFNQHENEIDEYLKKRNELIFVDAENTSENVKCSLMSSLIKSSYLMGFKQNFRD